MRLFIFIKGQPMPLAYNKHVTSAEGAGHLAEFVRLEGFSTMVGNQQQAQVLPSAITGIVCARVAMG